MQRMYREKSITTWCAGALAQMAFTIGTCQSNGISKLGRNSKDIAELLSYFIMGFAQVLWRATFAAVGVGVRASEWSVGDSLRTA